MKKIFVIGFVTFVSVVVFFGYLFISSGTVSSPKRNDVLDLTKDIYLKIGDVPIIAPLAVIIDRTNLEPTAASDSSKPLVVDRATLRVRALGWQEVAGAHGEHLCQRLTRQWARSICTDISTPLLQSLPYNTRIVLADIRKIESYARGYFFSGDGGTLWDRLQKVDLTSTDASISCEKKLNDARRSCTATIFISKYLIAIWPVFDIKSETAEKMATRQGAIIVEWVKSGLGVIEDFTALEAAAIKSIKP